MKKKVRSPLLALALCLSLLPAAAFAGDGDSESGGSAANVVSVTINGVTTEYSDIIEAFESVNYKNVNAAFELLYAKNNHILQTDGGTKVTIDVNGAILNNRANYGTIYINGADEQLDIYGKINGNICTNRGGGVVLSNNGSNQNATMYPGAEICNNTCEQTGGGVMVSMGTFTMKGGTISGNISGTNTTDDKDKVGGGVFVRRGGQFIMDGGVIEHNTATGIGGGVCFDASDNGGMVPKVELNSGTIENNLMNAAITVDSTNNTVTVSRGDSNDLAVTGTSYGKADRYLSISDEVTIGDKAVYFQTGTKTVTPADDSLDIKLGNASPDSADALKTASTDDYDWNEPLVTFWAQRNGAATLTVGGLTLTNDLPVYVLVQRTGEDGLPAAGADCTFYGAAVENDAVVLHRSCGCAEGQRLRHCPCSAQGGSWHTDHQRR